VLCCIDLFICIVAKAFSIKLLPYVLDNVTDDCN